MALGYGMMKLFEEVVEKNFEPKKLVFTRNEVLFIISELDNADKYMRNKQKKAPRYKVFKYFVRYCLYRNLANFDSLVLLTGDKGVGKSSFAIQLAREWCRLLGIPFNPDRFMAYTNYQVQKKIDTLPKFSPLICDEAINFATTENWAKVENKELKKKLGQVRTKHLFYILCFPLKIMKIDKVYLDSFVNYWIDMFGRGRGALFVKDRNPVHDAWRLQDFKDLGSYTEFSSMENIEKKLSRHPNFWYIITCGKLSDEIYRRYLLVREKNIYNDANAMSSVTKQDMYRAILVKVLEDIMIRDSSLSMKRLLLHIQNEYNITIKESELKFIIEDANQLVQKMQEEGKRTIEADDDEVSTEQSSTPEQVVANG